MHIIKLNIEDSVYEQFINFLKKLPNEKVEIIEDETSKYPPAISIDEAKKKVKKALQSNKEYSEEETFKILENALNENHL